MSTATAKRVPVLPSHFPPNLVLKVVYIYTGRSTFRTSGQQNLNFRTKSGISGKVEILVRPTKSAPDSDSGQIQPDRHSGRFWPDWRSDREILEILEILQNPENRRNRTNPDFSAKVEILAKSLISGSDRFRIQSLSRCVYVVSNVYNSCQECHPTACVLHACCMHGTLTHCTS